MAWDTGGGTWGVVHGDTGSGTLRHRQWDMGTEGVGHGDTGSGTWGPREWGKEIL